MLLAYRPNVASRDLGERSTFADLAATICDALNVPWSGHGRSFYQ